MTCYVDVRTKTAGHQQPYEKQSELPQKSLEPSEIIRGKFETSVMELFYGIIISWSYVIFLARTYLKPSCLLKNDVFF